MNKSGVIVRHYKDGAPCRGSGALPFEETCAALEAAHATLERRYRQLLKARASASLVAAIELGAVVCEMLRLERRIKRWRRTYGRDRKDAREGGSPMDTSS
ncbi:hypothetical protein [Hyphococcus luteus]|uniref:Uncharacterized protein n=1 Tax=Hyphococcus luteus TaxID=2058213 RepID=A0A2S7K011_9PROT|nr:hypothetical protein [Marinicaulis flavus]PQA85844.1 hypothetical protein CW354_20105 [Marinicaulis flavus]